MKILAIIVAVLAGLAIDAQAKPFRAASGQIAVSCPTTPGPGLISTCTPIGCSDTSQTLNSKWGVWSFGPNLIPPTTAGPPGPFGSYDYLKLNGEVLWGSLPAPASAIAVCSNNQVVFLLSQNDRLWYQWEGWQGRDFVGSPFVDPTLLLNTPVPATPPPYGPPYTPDGMSIPCGGAGTLTTIDGVWTCPASTPLLNGIASLATDRPSAVVALQVALNGTLWVQIPGNTWRAYFNHYWWPETTSLASIPGSPIPVRVTLSTNLICSLPTTCANYSPGLHGSTPVGTTLATITVTMSDGTTTCAGCTFSLYSSSSGTDLVVSGNNLNLNHTLTPPVGNFYRVTVIQGSFSTFAGASTFYALAEN